ncbi:hypothetical protein I3842_05G051300 [Carya illinoinensis]|uniref:Uncharacterized protein n=1 Tax=Carya illinoinensis TaxID=32201 RepID=A0A922F039_CARIL|nr:hypothetical protein I3842_05G051300 [Carya illinoinensis]
MVQEVPPTCKQRCMHGKIHLFTWDQSKTQLLPPSPMHRGNSFAIQKRVKLQRSHCSSAHNALTTWLLPKIVLLKKKKRRFDLGSFSLSPFEISPAKYILPRPRLVTFLCPEPPGDTVPLFSTTPEAHSSAQRHPFLQTHSTQTRHFSTFANTKKEMDMRMVLLSHPQLSLTLCPRFLRLYFTSIP